MKHLLRLLIPSLSFLCSVPHAPAQSPEELHYRFDLHDPAHIRITLTLTPTSHSQVLLLPSQWAGQTELYRAVSDLDLANPDVNATLLPSADPAHRLLHTRRLTPVSLSYTLSQDWSGPLRHPFEHRALLTPTLFELTGENSLVAPAIAGTKEVHATFDFDGLPRPQTLITSFGTEPHQSFSGPWSAVRNALFTGGKFNTAPLDVGGQPVILAMYGQWAFPITEVTHAVESILRTERRLWSDPAAPFYAIVIAPYEDPSSGGGGSGFTNISSLFLSDRQTFTPDTASLLAHEAFHTWNPTGLGAVQDTEQIAWFGEGFTRFFQDVVLERAGLITSTQYLARLNDTIREYHLSPRIHASNDDLQQTPATDLFAYQEPYLRGAMIALWLSSEITRQTAGRSTLTDLMLALRSGRSEPLSADRIFRTTRRFVDDATVAQRRSFALHGDTVPLPPGVLGECVAFNNHPAWTFDLGFDAASLHHQGIVHGVQYGSNAWQAGVRDGQQLGGFSLWNGNPEREVTLTLRETDGKREKLTFLPRGKLLSIPQAEQIPGCPKDPRIPL